MVCLDFAMAGPWSFYRVLGRQSLPLAVFCYMAKTQLVSRWPHRVRSDNFRRSISKTLGRVNGEGKEGREQVQEEAIEQYAHKGKQRANNPPVGLVTQTTDKESGKKIYAYISIRNSFEPARRSGCRLNCQRCSPSQQPNHCHNENSGKRKVQRQAEGTDGHALLDCG